MTSGESAAGGVSPSGAPRADSGTPPAPHVRIPDWGWDTIAVVAVIVSTVLPAPRPPFMHPAVPFLLLLPALFSAGALLLRRRWPIPVFVFCTAMYSVSAITGLASTGAGVAAVVAAFGVANRTNRRTAFLSGGVAAAVVATLSVTVSEWGVVDPRVFQVAAGIAVAAALGDSSRSRREYVAAVTERAERAEQTREAEGQRRVAEERLRIAQDLHDTVAHRISVISLNAGVASGALDERPEKAREALVTIRAAARGVLGDISDLLRYLRTNEGLAQPLLPQVGLQYLDPLIQRMSAAGLHVNAYVAGDLSLVTGNTDLVAYRVIQEGLTNAHKHGADHTADVNVSVGGGTLTVVITNPVSLERVNVPDAPGDRLGLIGIHERVASVRGTVSAGPVGDTFRLAAYLPVTKEAAA